MEKKLTEDVAAMSANIAAHTPEHFTKIKPQTPEDFVDNLSPEQLKEFLESIFREDEPYDADELETDYLYPIRDLENFTVD